MTKDRTKFAGISFEPPAATGDVKLLLFLMLHLSSDKVLVLRLLPTAYQYTLRIMVHFSQGKKYAFVQQHVFGGGRNVVSLEIQKILLQHTQKSRHFLKVHLRTVSSLSAYMEFYK